MASTPILKHKLVERVEKQNLSLYCLQETHLNLKDRYHLKVKGYLKKYSKEMGLGCRQMLLF